MRPTEPCFLTGGSRATMANNRQYRNAPSTEMDAQKTTVRGFSPVALRAALTPVRRDHRRVATPADCGRCGRACKGSAPRSESLSMLAAIDHASYLDIVYAG